MYRQSGWPRPQLLTLLWRNRPSRRRGARWSPCRPEPLEERPLPEVLAEAELVMNAVRHDGGEAPLDPVPGVGYAERAVPDPAHGRVRVRVGRGHKWREALGLGDARRHLGVNEQRGLQRPSVLSKLINL